MKKPKIAKKPTKTPVVKDSENHLGENCIYDICPDIWLATPHTIAMIAATLSRNTKDTPEALAESAMKLFYASVKRVIQADYNHEIHFRRLELKNDLGTESEDFIFDALNYKYPIKRDEFLNEFFRSTSLEGRTADMATLAKLYLKDTLRIANKREPSFDEVTEAYGNWKPCDNFREANQLFTRFYDWRMEHIKSSRRAAGLKSAAKKKLKKKL